MTGCVAQNNTLGNYNFPLTGTPSALGHQVTFGVAQIISCKSLGSSNTKDKLDGAQVSKEFYWVYKSIIYWKIII